MRYTCDHDLLTPAVLWSSLTSTALNAVLHLTRYDIQERLRLCHITPACQICEVCTGSCEEWVGWMEACRVGWRKALGYDMQRRRYWALGGGTGAWRVYVEEQEGSLWGWYEGTPP